MKNKILRTIQKVFCAVQVGTIHHDAETTQVWVVDKPAYTEYVYGEKCSGCGATKLQKS